MWNRRDWGRVCASALLTAGLPAARTETVPAAPPTVRAPLGRVVIAVDHKASFCYLPLTVAERLGYFAAEGLDVQVHDHGESDKALQALLSGAAQVLSGAYSNAINQQLQGQGLRCFVLQGRTPQLVLGVSQRSLPRFRDLGDLRGRRVAVPALGSASHRMARLMFERAGLKPLEVDYQVFSGPSATLAAFRTGQVEALCYHDPVITQLEQSGELRVVVDTRTLRGNAEVFGGPMPAGGLMARPLSRRLSAPGPGLDPCDGARAQMAADGGTVGPEQDRARAVLPGRPRPLSGRVPAGAGVLGARWPDARGRSADRDAHAGPFR
jgi:NitT/TauT family transport system substrate-binding protein